MKKVLFVFCLFFAFNYSVYATSLIVVPQNSYEFNHDKVNKMITYYDSNLKNDYEYFYIDVLGTLYAFNDYFDYTSATAYYLYTDTTSYSNYIALEFLDVLVCSDINSCVNESTYSIPLFGFNNLEESSDFYLPFATNLKVSLDSFSMFNNNDYFDELQISDFYSDNIILDSSTIIPNIYSLSNYSSWSEYQTENDSKYTTVNLNDYYYVLLNLKDYSKKEAFNTNLYVKGMVGITPIYNYGTVSKDDIIGNKVEDRCNLSYDDFTSYRLSILKSDLENNSIYAVKSCEDNSSFKFDNTLFDITYVTDENKNDPIVTINGKEYHTIPYDDLPSTATKNEEENYIPGESKPLGFNDIIENVTDILSSFWSSLTSFMSLVTKCFNSLPVEIRAISITTFTIGCILGLIKILKS